MSRMSSLVPMIACWLGFVVSPAHAEFTIFLQPNGNLNGQTIDASHYWISVNPGATISGTIKVQTNNDHPPSAVEPLGYTATWGDRAGQVVEVNPWIGTGTLNYDITVSKTAPTTPGNYFLPIAFSGCYNINEVMSATQPGYTPVWNDGNDVGWDWTAAQFQQARATGHMDQLYWNPGTQTWPMWSFGANWVGVNVVPEPSTLVLLGIGAISLLGYAWRRRRQAV